MAYASSFHRLVLIGKLYTEDWNTTLSIVHNTGAAVALPAVTTGLLNAVATAIQTWFPLAASASPGQGLGISSSANLVSVKLNRINSAGKYEDATAKEYIYATPIAAVGAAGIPPQLTLAASLSGAAPRAGAGRGRMYFPPTGALAGVATDGRLSISAATNYANGVKALLTAVNAAYAAQGVAAVAGIASKAGSGTFQVVTKVGVGRVIDTMRSRRNKLVEAPFELAVP